jgi:hypothetical protein
MWERVVICEEMGTIRVVVVGTSGLQKTQNVGAGSYSFDS